MSLKKEDEICALCKWNKNVASSFFCSNINQKDMKLKSATNYNDSCSLFEEKEERKNIYDLK